VSVYLDANVLVALFFPDDQFSSRADTLLRTNPATTIVSDFAAAEFASVVARHVRIGFTTAATARNVFNDFDHWTGTATHREHTTSEDVATAESFLRRLDLNLRTPDALHLALSQRLRAEFATFDKVLAAGARALKISLASA
jgi:predicted nucleic acid-binding protein